MNTLPALPSTSALNLDLRWLTYTSWAASPTAALAPFTAISMRVCCLTVKSLHPRWQLSSLKPRVCTPS